MKSELVKFKLPNYESFTELLTLEAIAKLKYGQLIYLSSNGSKDTRTVMIASEPTQIEEGDKKIWEIEVYQQMMSGA